MDLAWGLGTTTNAIILIGYAIGNAAGPFMWKKAYQPRYFLLIPPSLNPHTGVTGITYPGQSSLLACLPVYFSCFFCASCLHRKTNAVGRSRGTKGMMSFILLKNYQTGRGWRKGLIRHFSI